jgi:hypothetical protein
MVYDRYKLAAEVDWISTQLTTARITNAQTVMRHLPGASFVQAVQAGDAGEASQFIVRVQQPDSWTQIDKSVAILSASVPLVGMPAVAGIELAFDAYSKAQNPDDVVGMAARLYTGIQNTASFNHRFSGVPGKKFPIGIQHQKALHRHLADGRVIFIGNRGDVHYQRVYVKTTDNGHELPSHLHRARFENCLSSERLPRLTWAEWHDYDFAQLSHWFKFRLIADDGYPPEARLLFAWLPQVGQLRRTKRRKFPPFTRADVALNRKAYDALRRLTGKMQKLRTVGSCNPLNSLESRAAV